jgi:Flp pilus assembly pilin Flp
MSNTIALIELFKLLFNLSRASGATKVESTTIAVVNAVDVIGASDL